MTSIINKLCWRNDSPLSDYGNDNKMLRIIAISSWCLLLAAQVIMIFIFNGEQVSDSKGYLLYATELVKNNGWYPSTENLTNQYIFGNGYVNFMILIMHFTSDLRVLYIFNIIFCQIILFASLYIINRLSDNRRIAYFYIILFCFLNTFWSEVVSLRTELPFTALVFSAFAVLCSEKKYKIIISGLLIGLGNWVRPLGIPFMIGAIVFLIVTESKCKEIIKLLFTYIFVLILIGTFTYFNCGHFIYQPTTLGVNLIMSANDDANGSFMDRAYIKSIDDMDTENMIYKDYDEYYIKKSLKWIKENPFRYLSQIPRKLFYLYSTETYSSSSFFDNKISTGGIQYVKSVFDKLSGTSKEQFTFADFLVCFNQIWYIIIMCLAFIGIIISFIKNHWRHFLPLYLIVIFGTLISIIVVCGARYHFPYLPIFMMLSAYTLNNLLQRKMKL